MNIWAEMPLTFMGRRPTLNLNRGNATKPFGSGLGRDTMSTGA